MHTHFRKLTWLIALMGVVLFLCCQFVYNSSSKRLTQDFNSNWHFHLGEIKNGQDPELNTSTWRLLDLPHDWSIEGDFSPEHPATPGGGALPGGIGWYRKMFHMPSSRNHMQTFIELTRTRSVITKRFFDDDTSPTVFIIIKTRLA